MTDIPFIDCTGLVPQGSRLSIYGVTVPKNALLNCAPHWDVALELWHHGYKIKFNFREPVFDQHPGQGWDEKHTYISQVESIPHPCDPARQDDSMWPVLHWRSALYRREWPDADEFATGNLRAAAIDLLRTDSFFRLR